MRNVGRVVRDRKKSAARAQNGNRIRRQQTIYERKRTVYRRFDTRPGALRLLFAARHLFDDGKHYGDDLRRVQTSAFGFR